MYDLNTVLASAQKYADQAGQPVAVIVVVPASASAVQALRPNGSLTPAGPVPIPLPKGVKRVTDFVAVPDRPVARIRRDKGKTELTVQGTEIKEANFEFRGKTLRVTLAHVEHAPGQEAFRLRQRELPVRFRARRLRARRGRYPQG